MKQLLYTFLIKLIGPLANRLGFHRGQTVRTIVKTEKTSLLDIFFSNIKQMNFTPKHFIDIGANHGHWTREMLQHFPTAYVTMIEPQQWLSPSFQDLLDNNNRITYHAVGAGDQEGSFKFTIVDRDDSCSFRFTEEEAKAKGFKQEEIPVVTLNQLVADRGDKPFPDLVKIDAEGLDLNVLKGAETLFGITEVFMVEAAVYNKDFDNSFLAMMNFMDSKGYRLFEITDLNRPFSPAILWLVELAFVKKGGLLDSYQINKKVVA